MLEGLVLLLIFQDTRKLLVMWFRAMWSVTSENMAA